MLKIILWRLSQVIVLSVLILSIVFVAIRLIPGDPAAVLLGARATQEEIANLREKMGLNKPISEQYVTFMKGVFQGDLGDSFFFEKPITELILERIPLTFKFAVLTMVWILLIGIPVGIFSALYENSFLDYIVRFVVFLGQAIADFWLAIMMILIFGVQLRLLPTFGSDTWQHFILPTIALGITRLPRVMRFTRTGMIDVINQDYMRTARAKGLPYKRVIIKHGLRNLLIPLITDTGLTFGWLLGGAVVIETVFALPGIGRLTVEAVQYRDYFLLQGAVLFFAVTFLLINMLIDLTYKFLDPRVKIST